MAYPERDRGKSAASAIPERLDSRVVIVPPPTLAWERPSVRVDQQAVYVSNVGL